MHVNNVSLRTWGRVMVAAVLLAIVASSADAGGGKGETDRSGNYMIIAAEDYSGSLPLDQFVAAKEAMGFDVTTYPVSSGTSNTTIKSWVQALWGTPDAPDYILLVGDTSGSTSTATTVPHFIGGGSKSAPTDLPYACMDGGDDWYPDIAIGRFSVTSVSMLQIVVDKSLFVEAGNFSDPEYVKRGAFLANPSTYGMAEPTHDWVIEHYFEPNDYVGVKLYSSEGAGTQDVTNAINNGCLWFGYYGHSGSSGWWDPSFSQSDVQALTNAGLYGVGWSFSCNVGNFTLGECFGETWVREVDKGAAAVIFPSGYIYWGSAEAWEPSTVLEKAFFRSFFERGIWEVGPAWQAALYNFREKFTGSTDIERNFFELYNLLGDPALLLPQAYGFTLVPDPVSHDLCCPPADQAVYTIEVGQLGEFSEPVTLGLTGEPAGATVDFSVNSVPPPFTSVMTVDNLAGASAGDYALVLSGTTASMQRATSLGLNIANGVPAVVTLISPPDGATDVALTPELTWEPSTGAQSYDLEVASDPAFTDIVYSATTDGASHTVGTPLDMLGTYHWHVRGANACGDGDFSETFDFTTVNMIAPVAYDMLNGETGTYTYFDDTYDGDGDPGVALSPLSNGLGDLTDGVRASDNWGSTPVPYVGWHTIDPTITFHFAESVNIDAVTIHVDDSNGSGGVYPPADVVIAMGGVVLPFPVTDPSGGEPFDVSFIDLGLSGDTLELTLNRTSSNYMMLSEVEFFGGPTYESACLIISEVVQGAESGSCPRWIEITNTGLNDYLFDEGGIIVQMDESSDVVVDVDLGGQTIRAGEAYVVNSDYECSGAFDFIYQEEADFYTMAELGQGDDRYILTDTADGSNLLDIYGEFGVDGTGEVWEYTNSYAYRLSAYNMGSGQDFASDEWFYGGVDALKNGDPTQLLLDYTSPGVHIYDEDCTGRPGDMDCDGDTDLDDLPHFVDALLGNPPAHTGIDQSCADMDGDGDRDGQDIHLFVEELVGS